MAFVYLVRCNFTCADRERAWNEWYNGPKLANMLAKPLFESGQRFEAAGVDADVRYLAVWGLTSPEAFETPEYRSDWGFAEYADCIGDWTRDLCRIDGDDSPAWLGCPLDARLHVVRVEGGDEAEGRRARDAVDARCPGLAWGTAVGLDRSAPYVGLRVLAGGMEQAAPDLDGLPVGQTVFRPLIPQTYAAS